MPERYFLNLPASSHIPLTLPRNGLRLVMERGYATALPSSRAIPEGAVRRIRTRLS